MSLVNVNKLTKIPIDKLAQLRDLYKADLPKHVIAYSTIQGFNTRLKNCTENENKVQILCLNNDWESDGTFIILSRNDLIFNTLDESCERLKIALRLIDYENIKMYTCVREFFHPMIMDVIKDKNLKMTFDNGTKCYWMSKEIARELEVVIPNGFELRSLSKIDAIKMNSVWPHAHESSQQFLELLIEVNPSVGLYNDNGELVAWSVDLEVAALGALQVDANYLRKGFGSIVAKGLSKKIAIERDHDITAHIILANTNSLSMFQKIGFKEIDSNYWIGIEETKMKISNTGSQTV